MKLKLLNTFSCAAIYNSLKTMKKLTSYLNLNVKDKVSFLLYGSQSSTSKSSDHEILTFVINYIKETGCFDRPVIDKLPIIILFLHYVVIYRYISDINVLCSIHCERMYLLMWSPAFFIDVFYLVLFCIHVCVDVIEKKSLAPELVDKSNETSYFLPQCTVSSGSEVNSSSRYKSDA